MSVYLVIGCQWLRESREVWTNSYLREGTVVPQVTLVGEAVADVAKLALLDVLLNGVQELLLGDLCVKHRQFRASSRGTREEKVWFM